MISFLLLMEERCESLLDGIGKAGKLSIGASSAGKTNDQRAAASDAEGRVPRAPKAGCGVL